MNILINFSTLKSGGGQNVALNFINIYEQINTSDSFYFATAHDSVIEKELLSKIERDRILSLSNHPIKRIFEEKFLSHSFLKKNNINLIYTYFGFGLFPRSIPQVMGSADSNLFFPEIDFWYQYKGLHYYFKKAIDKYRIYGLKRCNGIIFETELLEKKFRQLYKSNAISTTIRPSINLNFDKDVLELSNLKDCPKGLFLCGWQLNKNILLIPQIAHFLKKANFQYQFIITAQNNDCKIKRDFEDLVNYYNVKDYIYITGVIPKKCIHNLYEQIDCVFLLSKLESFSNNIIEAWTYKRLLIVSDEPWAKWICKDGAFYVPRDDAKKISEDIIKICSDKDLYFDIVKKGEENLKYYPSIKEKTSQEFVFLKKVYEHCYQ